MKRRSFLKRTGSAVLLPLIPAPALALDLNLGLGLGLAEGGPLTRPIPSSGAQIPAIGMGTWITFNVGASERLRQERLAVLRTFFELGGGMVDSSPMYGTAEDVLGWCLSRLESGVSDGLISATKIWTPAGGDGHRQMAEARRLWGLDRMDVMQVHNLVDWREHLTAIREAREQGHVRYAGITTSHGMRHDEMMHIMENEPLDFVQFTYNAVDREAENRLLPMAADKGIAVIANRPFRRGALPDRLQGTPLPTWAGDYGITNWPQFLLKFIISHPAVTCAIPATSNVAHMRENMNALHGPLPDAKTRARMADAVADAL